MKGIYLINDRIKINDFSKEESVALQKLSILNFIEKENIQIVRLNPYQIYEYYTIPHALLYDLKKEKNRCDYLIYYSSQILEDFIYTYPARWLILKSYFKEIINLEEHKNITGKQIV